MSLTLDKLEDKKSLVKALRKQVALKSKFGLLYYIPHHKQDCFHRAGDRKRRYMRTGNRFGKSDMGSAEASAWALGYRPWYENSFEVLNGQKEVTRRHEGRPDHPDCFTGIPKRPTKGLIICQDWDKAREIFTSEEHGLGRGKLFKFLPDLRKNDDGKSVGIIRTERSSTGAINLLYVRSKWGGISTIHFDTVRSFKSDGMGQESSNWDWIMIDEPCPEAMWKAASRGLIDAYGSAWFNCTPLRERWINDMFFPSARTVPDETQENIYQIKGQDRWVMVGNTYDNPHLSSKAIEAFISDLDKDEVETRIKGKPSHYQGLIYSQFDYSRHVYTQTPHGWESPTKPPAHYKVRTVIDPHPKTPHAVLMAATAPTGEVFFFHEIFEHCLAKDLARQIVAVYEDGGYEMDNIPCDWVAFEESPTTGESMEDDFIEEGIHIEKAPRELTRGIMVTRQALSRPNYLYFYAGLDRTLYEMDSYAWDEKKEKPVDENDHMMENLYRLVLGGLDYEEPRIMTDRRPASSLTMSDVNNIDYSISDSSFDLPAEQDWIAAMGPGTVYRGRKRIS